MNEGAISAADIQQPDKGMIGLLQLIFSFEINHLEKATLASADGYRLQKINPVFSEGLLRVGGQLQNNDVNF